MRKIKIEFLALLTISLLVLPVFATDTNEPALILLDDNGDLLPNGEMGVSTDYRLSVAQKATYLATKIITATVFLKLRHCPAPGGGFASSRKIVEPSGL